MEITVPANVLMDMLKTHIEDCGFNTDGQELSVKFKGGRVHPPFAVVNIEPKTDGLEIVVEAFEKDGEETGILMPPTPEYDAEDEQDDILDEDEEDTADLFDDD